MLLPLLAVIESDSDREFMIRLYQQYYPLMRSKAYGIVRDYNIVDDIIDEACVRLIEKISLLRDFECCKLATYIVYTIRSVSIDFVRRRNLRNKWTYYGLEDDAAEVVADNGRTIEELIIKSEEIAELRSAILKLPERDRDVLHYKYTLEMNDAQIAQIIGTRPSSVRSIIARTRKKVYSIMREEGFGHER